MVSAWDTENGLCLGQVATKNDEGKEVGGCYKEITGAIVAGGGDYAITLKANQLTLHEIAKSVFAEHERNDFADVACYSETNRGHGRVEQRTYYAVPIPDAPRLEKWPGLSTFVMGRFHRTVGDKEEQHTRYFITSLLTDDVQRLGQVLRSHWGIENSLHWVLDVSFGEDANRTRRGNGAENLSILRRIGLGMLNQIKGKKTIPNVKFQAAVDPEFRTTIITKFLNF